MYMYSTCMFLLYNYGIERGHKDIAEVIKQRKFPPTVSKTNKYSYIASFMVA